MKRNDHDDFFIVSWIEHDEKHYMWRNDYDYMKNEDNLINAY
jgi:hypothetical protein